MTGIRNTISRIREKNAFVNATFVYILANGIGQGTTLLANSFFTRYMTRSDFGTYSTYYSYVALLVPFVGMNLYVGLSNAYIDHKNVIHKFRSSTLMLSVFGLIVSSAIMLLANMVIDLQITTIGVLLSLAHAYGFFLVNFYIQSMNMENRYVAKGLMLAIPNILQALLAILAVLLCNTFVSRAIGATAGILSSGILATILILRVAKPAINKDYWKYTLKISLPAIIGSVSTMIMQQCDKVMITSMIDSEATAVYALVYNIGYILYAIQQATNGAWQAWLYNAKKKKKYGIIAVVQKWYLYFMVVVATGLYMIAPEIVRVLSPDSYWTFEYVTPFVIGSYLMLMYSLNIGVMQYRKRTGVVSLVVAIAALINIILNYCLIPRFGGVGAAYTSVASYAFILIASCVYLTIKKDFYFKHKYNIVSIAWVILLGIVFYMVMNTMVLRYVIFLSVLVIELLYLLVRKSEIWSLYSGSKNKSDTDS